MKQQNSVPCIRQATEFSFFDIRLGKCFLTKAFPQMTGLEDAHAGGDLTDRRIGIQQMVMQERL